MPSTNPTRLLLARFRWGTTNFRQLGLRKCELILSLLRAGADPIVTDADALITRDPTPFISRLLPEAQVGAKGEGEGSGGSGKRRARA
jgi:hypothetical protein